MYLQRAGHGGVTESVACRVSLGRRLNVRALAVRLAHKTHLGRLTNKQTVCFDARAGRVFSAF